MAKKHKASIVPVHAHLGGITVHAAGAGSHATSKGAAPHKQQQQQQQNKQRQHGKKQPGPQQQQQQQEQEQPHHKPRVPEGLQHRSSLKLGAPQADAAGAGGPRATKTPAADAPNGTAQMGRHKHKKQRVDGAVDGAERQQQQQQQQQQHGDQLHRQVPKQLKAGGARESVVGKEPEPDQPPKQQQKATRKHKKRQRSSGGPAIDSAQVAAVAQAPPGSNWLALKEQLKVQAATAQRFRRRPQAKAGGAASASGAAAAVPKPITSIGSSTALTRVVAVDCEFVGVGPGGEMDALARVSVVNNEGNVLLDTFVEVKEKVTDYRTWVSGVRPQDLVGAPSLEKVQEQVAKLVEGRTLVGHSLSKDMKVLLLGHPKKDIRDTAKYPPLMFSRGGKRRPQSLKQLAKKELGLDIQAGEHSSVDDARATLYLYHKHRKEWEKAVRAGAVSKLPTAGQVARKHPSYGSRDIRDDPMADL